MTCEGGRRSLRGLETRETRKQRTTQLRCLGDGGAVARANAGYLYVLRKGDCGRTEEEAF